MDVIIFSTKICLIVSLINLVFGTSIGIILSQKRSMIFRLMEIFITLPLIFPPIALGFFFLIIFGREGIIGRGLNSVFDINIIFSPTGVIFAALISGFPLMVKSVTASAGVLDKSIIEVSRIIGASSVQIFLYIIIPNISKGLISGLTLSFARSIGEVGMTLMLGGNVIGKTETISLAIYNAVFEGDFFKATKLSIILAVVATVVFMIIQHFDKGEN